MQILGLDALTHIEAAAHRTGVALLTDVAALLVLLVLVQTLSGVDGQITVLQLHLDLVLLKAGQVNVHQIGILRLADIGLHHVLGVLAIQGVVDAGHHTKSVIEHIIEQILTKNAGQHKSFLQFKSFDS